MMALAASEMTYTRIQEAFIGAVGEERWKALPRQEQFTAISLVQGRARKAAQDALDELVVVILQPSPSGGDRV